MKILMVCLGNICRSPMAEGVMRHLVEKKELDWEIDSAGTGGWHLGEAPDKRAIRTAANHGIDISGLKARKFSERDFGRFDHIFVMDSTNYSDVISLSENDEERNKVKLFLEAADPNSPEKNVTDPWFEDRLFEPVFLGIREACEKLIEKLRS
ncbi:protein-tyrosine phosphatase [Anseongella ginsenosidimutans]|uniref:protein-tyrosine-phosphatase n=1 Tax=Anseongella ginsenosidimutans TaxID=496056 RepID=A0A4R3KXF1_9SPHI|nr:low molecular weight protein-tyrosine-phosphatase [Anseongella ginsenosidimutans]QEC51782.1 low molecular weight phosphotyrosine protein phosphatase [Anseongella ginsenosidimutans]TCS89150.1 protein-tyrosine phosphatase [Anseongella ginsenosidimutans]